MLSEPKILILDEATSALNPTDEMLIIDAIRQLRGKMTIIVVAHRPSSIAWADKFITLEKGQLTDQGSWEELMAKPDGFLARMIKADRHWMSDQPDA